MGLKVHASPSLSDCLWYGYGEETYPDRKASGTFGRYHSPVDSQGASFYIRPQEYGDHQETRIFCVQKTIPSGCDRGLALVGQVPMAMKAVPWTSEQLASCSHAAQLPPSKDVWVYVDFLQTGLGNASCGAEVLPPYQVVPGHYRFSLSLIPYEKDTDPFVLKNFVYPPSYAPKEIAVDPLPGQTMDRLFHRYHDPSDPQIREALGY